MNTLGLQLVDDYFRWLRSHTQVRDVEGWTEITVPFLDRHNDHLQLYVQPHNGDYVLTDDGYTWRCPGAGSRAPSVESFWTRRSMALG